MPVVDCCVSTFQSTPPRSSTVASAFFRCTQQYFPFGWTAGWLFFGEIVWRYQDDSVWIAGRLEHNPPKRRQSPAFAFHCIAISRTRELHRRTLCLPELHTAAQQIKRQRSPYLSAAEQHSRAGLRNLLLIFGSHILQMQQDNSLQNFAIVRTLYFDLFNCSCYNLLQFYNLRQVFSE